MSDEPLHIEDQPAGQTTAQDKLKVKGPWWLRLIKFVGRAIVIMVGSIVLLISLLALAIHIPAVQRRLVATLNESVSDLLKFDVHVGYVYISWLDTIVMKDVLIKDRNDNPMIAVQDLRVRFNLTALLNHTILVRAAYLDHADVRMYYQEKDKAFNINQFADAILAATYDPKAPYNPDPPAFTIQNVVLEDTRFIYSDPSQDTIRWGFDYLHQEFTNVNMSVEDFYLKGKFIGFNVKSMRAKERYSKLDIKQLSGYLAMDSTYMRLDRLDARIGKGTHLKRSLAFRFRDWSKFAYFNDSITIEANLDTSYIDFDDLRAFAPDLPKLKERIWVKSKFSGLINNFKIKNLAAGFGRGSTINGSVAMKGLPNWDTTHLEVNIRKSKLIATDISKYLDSASRIYVNPLGQMAIKGFYQGTPTKFKLFADAQTSIGMVSSNLNMHIKPDNRQTTYVGQLVTKGFDVGALIGQQQLLQLMDVNTDFDGRGFDQTSLRLALKGKADQFGLNGYSIKGIVVDGLFQNQTFEGLLAVNDPNVDGAAKGKIELGVKPEVIKLDINLKHANLAKFNILPHLTHLAGKFNTDIKGLNPNDIRGIIKGNGIHATVKGRDIYLEEVAIRKYWQDENQVLELESDWADLSLIGNYKLTALIDDATALGKEYGMFFAQNPAKQRAYYTKHQPILNPFSLTIKVDIKDPKPILAMYAPDVILSNNTVLNGSYTSGANAVLLLNTEMDSVGVGKNLMQQVNLDINSSKSRSSPNVLASAHLSSSSQNLFSLNPTNDLLIDAEWNNEKISFRSNIDQQQPAGSIYQTPNKLSLGGMLSFYEDRYTVTFGESALRLMDEDWRLDANNQLSIFYNSAILIDKFEMGNEEQNIYAKGALGVKQEDSLLVRIKKLDLNLLSSIIGKPIGGMADANIHIRAALGIPAIRGLIKVDSLKLDKFLVGDVIGTSGWDNENKWLRMDLDLTRSGAHMLALNGHYAPSKESPIVMTAKVTGMPMKIMETFLGSIMSNWGGTATGKLNLTGRFDKLVVDGPLEISGGVFKYDYLNANYRFNDRIMFSKNLISMDNTVLTDAYNQKAYMRKMRITHQYFQQYGIDCEADLVDFQVMNTTAEQNKLYYGTVSASGPFLMKGNFDNLYIKGDLTSSRNTLVNIPIKSGSSETEQLSFIQFTDSQKPLSLVSDSLKRKLDLEGITMDFNLNITQEAEIDIVFNAKNGEVIKAQGDGKLRLRIDTRGDFTMYGDYTISKGTYNFIFLNAVNKKFDLQRGSSLTWTGSPTGALLKISAKHRLNASLRPLVFSLDSATLQRPELRRKYPVTVNMDITGDMLKPSIVFGIEIERNYPTTISPDVTSFESRIQTDEQELNRQVFSLFLVRAFLPVSTVAGGADNLFASGSTATISEMLSNQISNLLSNVDQNLSVDIDVNGWDQNALNALQLRLSYTLWEGRVRIARSGGVTNAQNQTTAASIAGDWLVEYMLSKDGIFRLRAFIRNNAALATQGFNSSQQNITTSGFTVLHTQSFDHVRELFIRPKAIMPQPNRVDFSNDSSAAKPNLDSLKPIDKPADQPVIKPAKRDTSSSAGVKNSTSDRPTKPLTRYHDFDKPKPWPTAITPDDDRDLYPEIEPTIPPHINQLAEPNSGTKLPKQGNHTKLDPIDRR